MFDPPISTSNLYAPKFGRVLEILETGLDPEDQLASGALVKQLESELCSYHQSEFCVAFSTGFWALVATITLKAIPGRSEIIIPSMTYRRLADVVFWSGRTPVFVDIEPQQLSICPDAVLANLDRETGLILAVHPIVNCCQVDVLIDLADAHQLPIVFDGVESAHETYQTKRIGSFGVGEVFSLHASKLINGLEGGYVCTNDAELHRQLVDFRSGLEIELDHPMGAQKVTGLHSQMNDIHAAVALAGLQEVQDNVRHNRSIFRAYQRELNCCRGIRLKPFDESEQTSFKNIVVEVLADFPQTRDELVNRLNAAGILARPHYYPALHTKTYQYPVRCGDMATTEWAMGAFINLPCGARVSIDDVKRVCQLLNEIASS